MDLCGQLSILVTPYSAPKILVYPVFAVRKLLQRLSGTASVWWYRYWHALFLRIALKRTLSKITNCVVYAQCPLSARAGMQARRNAEQQVVMIVHFNHSQADEWSEKGAISRDGLLARSIRALERRVLPSLDAIVYVSHYMQCQLESAVPLLHEVENAVIPNCCARPNMGGRNLEPVDIVNVGTLEPRKNQQFLLEVLAYAARQGKNYTLALVGDGPDRLMLERMAHDLGVDKQVRFLGNRPRAIQLMSSARICAHAATIENSPLTLIEALACGLPIIAPAVGGIPELFEQGEAGFFWKLDDVQAAGELLIRILEDGAKLEAMALAAKARFDERFDASQVVGRLYEFIVNRAG
jgi:glycosyltransferase involved in cell wall biosynthesis